MISPTFDGLPGMQKRVQVVRLLSVTCFFKWQTPAHRPAFVATLQRFEIEMCWKEEPLARSKKVSYVPRADILGGRENHTQVCFTGGHVVGVPVGVKTHLKLSSQPILRVFP